MIWVVLFFQVIILIHLGSQAPPNVKPYWKGRLWACKEYYDKARTVKELRRSVSRSLEPDDFERGALDALRELEKRHVD